MLIEIWDYFMRRKALLTLILAAFILSGFSISKVLEKVTAQPKTPAPEVTYIQIQEWGTPEGTVTAWPENPVDESSRQDPSADNRVEVPHTGQDQVYNNIVLSPSDVALLPAPEQQATGNSDAVISDTTSPVDVITTPEADRIKSEVTTREHQLTITEALSDLTLILLGIGIIILGAYLTYQHFMR